MAVQRLVRCDQGHVFDAGAEPACPQCGWRLAETSGDPQGGGNGAGRRAAPRAGLLFAALAGLVFAGAAALWLLPGDGTATDGDHAGEAAATGGPEPAVATPEATAQVAPMDPGAAEAAEGGVASGPADDGGEPGNAGAQDGAAAPDAAIADTPEPALAAVRDVAPGRDPGDPAGPVAEGETDPASGAEAQVPRDGTGTAPADLAAARTADDPSGGGETGARGDGIADGPMPETSAEAAAPDGSDAHDAAAGGETAPDERAEPRPKGPATISGPADPPDRVAGGEDQPALSGASASRGPGPDPDVDEAQPEMAHTLPAPPAPAGKEAAATLPAPAPDEATAGEAARATVRPEGAPVAGGDPSERAAPAPAPAGDATTGAPGPGERSDGRDDADRLALLREPPPEPAPATAEAGLVALFTVAPESLAAARRALAARPGGSLPGTLAALSPHAEAEDALELSHALRHALALARAERAAAQGDTAAARRLFAPLAADATVAAGAPNARALFGLGHLLWRAPGAADRAEGARLLRRAAEQGGLTGAVDLLMSDPALLEAAALTPEALAAVLESAYLQSPARFVPRLAARDIDASALGGTAAALRAAARSGDTRAFARAHAVLGARPAPVIESLLAVTLEADTRLGATPRAAERQLVAALVSGLAGVTDGRVALALLAERGQAGVAAHLPDAVLWLVLALSDLAADHSQRPGIDGLLRDWARRLPPDQAALVARIAADFGVR